MNTLYNTRQRKIYNDYNSWSSEKLTEILKNRDNYNRDIIGVIEDILKERNIPVPPPPEEKPVFRPVTETEYFEKEKLRAEKEGTLRKFISELRELPAEEIISIITRYSYYQPEKLEAAMSVAVDRGIISFDLRQSLQAQMEANLDRHWDRRAKFPWETNNAFVEFASRYSDDEIYNIIDDPREMVIDVYHAVLQTALKRELISGEDFEEYFKGAKSALTTDFEKNIDDFYKELDLPAGNFDEETLKAEAGKYRVCPNCNEMVEAELSVCWNCQAEIPETAVVPDVEKVRNEIISEQKGLNIHPAFLIIGLVILIFGGTVLRDFLRHGELFPHKYSLALLGVMIVGGILWGFYKFRQISDD
jgi:hypothetical protein